MRDVASLADAFLSRITEDETGLWELDDETIRALPSASGSERRQLAVRALSILLERRLVAARQSEPFRAGSDLDPDVAISILPEPESWTRPEREGSLTLMLEATPEGRTFYFGGHKIVEDAT